MNISFRSSSFHHLNGDELITVEELFAVKLAFKFRCVYFGPKSGSFCIIWLLKVVRALRAGI